MPENYRFSTTLFFEENTPKAFGVEFGSISMVNLIQLPEAKINLEEAQKLIENVASTENERKLAIEKIALAFELLMSDYSQKTKNPGFTEPYYLRPDSLSTPRSSLPYHHNPTEDYKILTQHSEDIAELRQVVKELYFVNRVLTAGLDYGIYTKFNSIRPRIMTYTGGKIEFIHLHGSRDALGVFHPQSPTIEECRFCFDFVINSALRIQEV
jgi:hypothetical protein